MSAEKYEVHVAGILKLGDVFAALGVAQYTKQQADLAVAQRLLIRTDIYLNTHSLRRSIYIRAMRDEAYERLAALEKEIADGHRL